MKPKDTLSLNAMDWSVKMLFKWVISSWGWREDRWKLYQSKIRFLRLKRLRIWCQWSRYWWTRLCCASGRSVRDLCSCCQLEIGVARFFSIGVDFVCWFFALKENKGCVNRMSLMCSKYNFALFHLSWSLPTPKITANSTPITKQNGDSHTEYMENQT